VKLQHWTPAEAIAFRRLSLEVIWLASDARHVMPLFRQAAVHVVAAPRKIKFLSAKIQVVVGSGVGAGVGAGVGTGVG